MASDRRGSRSTRSDDKSNDRRGHTRFAQDDDPPYSRLFIVHQKGVSDELFRESFDKYGSVQDVWTVKDRVTGEEKGVTYVKFAKASEAALAMEEMHGRCLGEHPRPIKVFLANARQEGTRDPSDDVRLLRVFVMIPKTFTEEDLRNEFKQFGPIDRVTVVSDRSTGKPKGFGYISYHRSYHAALAVEKCDSTFRPKFADPKVPRSKRDAQYGGSGGGGGGGGGYDDQWRNNSRDSGSGTRSGYCGALMDLPPIMPSGGGSGGGGVSMDIATYPHQGQNKLEAFVSSSDANRQQLQSLFDIIPGLDYFEYDSRRGMVYVSYTQPGCAAYALDKLNGFEYPPGFRLSLRYYSGARSQSIGNDGNMDGNAQQMKMFFEMFQKMSQSMNQPTDQMSQMMTMMQTMVGSGGGGGGGQDGGWQRGGGRSNNDLDPAIYSSVPLPSLKPMAQPNSECMERLFIVCQPRSVAEYYIRDALQRFGNLMEFYLVPGKNYGYAKFASKESAHKAIDLLHGCEIDGARLKVMVSDPPKDERLHKRGHDDDDSMSLKRRRSMDHS